MNSRIVQNLFFRLGLIFFPAMLLVSCLLGPWNLTHQNSPAKVQLEVSCILVSGHPFDTLFLERPLSFNNGYDSTIGFVDTTASQILVIRTDIAPSETVSYAMSPMDTRVWLPRRRGNLQDTVRIGAHYHLAASIKWDAAHEFPQAHEFHLDSLNAFTYIPTHYHIAQTAMVPIEALHPSLSIGLSLATTSLALSDPNQLQNLYDSLNTLHSLTQNNITKKDLAQYLQGQLVLKPLHTGDSAYFIFDSTQVMGLNSQDPGSISRFAQQWKFIQDIDHKEYGGLISILGFDTSASRIIDPTPSLQSLFGDKKIDSARLYQIGNRRLLHITAAILPGITSYPDSVGWVNTDFKYTGHCVLYFYSVDSLYINYQRGINPPQILNLGGGGGGNGGGGRNRAPANIVHFSNIQGGDGFFTAAALDSFVVEMKAVQNTIPVPALHQAWAKDQQRRNNGGG